MPCECITRNRLKRFVYLILFRYQKRLRETPVYTRILHCFSILLESFIQKTLFNKAQIVTFRFCRNFILNNKLLNNALIVTHGRHDLFLCLTSQNVHQYFIENHNIFHTGCKRWNAGLLVNILTINE